MRARLRICMFDLDTSFVRKITATEPERSCFSKGERLADYRLNLNNQAANKAARHVPSTSTWRVLKAFENACASRGSRSNFFSS
ncbi:hypothetical protein TcasGA2_TC013158 [Tribolium castaneum]|uniref:Uncharacterized protein n=1 Tax=Tribolium castaneum TaxID=7070 RepID=D6WNE8_TRICA|nr:hypothetical protein TcasGA2_TC013158 [Tribolium castaneum]